MILQLIFLSAFLLSYNIAMPLAQAGGECTPPTVGDDYKMRSLDRVCEKYNYNPPLIHSFTFLHTDDIINADAAFLYPPNTDEKIQNLCFDHEALCTRRLNYTLSPSNINPEYAYCHWEYECKYDPHRIPFFLCEAKCQESSCQCPIGYACEPILYSVPVLKAKVDPCIHRNDFNFTDTSVIWEWQQEAIPVSCACKRAEPTCT